MHISNVDFACYIAGGAILGVLVRDFTYERLPLCSASRISLSAPSAKLNVAGAQLSFGGRENNYWHVLDLFRACAMFIVSAHVRVASLD